MKFNWGHAIAIAFTLFAAYILYFVVQSFSMDIDLVAEDYYAQEVAFQSRIDHTVNAESIKDDIQVQVGNTGVMLVFPSDFDPQVDEGLVTFFRPSEQDLDRAFPLTLDPSNRMFFPTEVLTKGRYEVKVSWSAKGVGYYVTKDVFI